MGKIYARMIHNGQLTLADVPELWKQATCDAYFELFGENLEPIVEKVSGSKKKK